MGDSMEFSNIFEEAMGALYPGRLKFSDSSVVFKNEKTGKLSTINTSDLVNINWQRLGNKPGIKLTLNDGSKFRFGGFRDSDLDQIQKYSNKHWSTDVDQNELQLKGWNHGNCQVKGKSIEFSLDERPVFDIPLSNVSNCVANKNEATVEFHQNDDAHTTLIEMRFHMPVDPDDEDADPVEEFRKAVMALAGVESESGQPIASLSQILCMTPRGRYDIKVYPNHLSLHGKTYDYKIPMRTIMRLFLVPHKDGRHMYFVIHLNPPIRQGQTRYGYLVLEFTKEEEIELALGLTDDQMKEYDGKLDKEMSGPVFEVISKIFRVLVNMKITVPGSFIGHSGTPAVQCAHRQASGFLYPLEKGFLYIHKPPMYVRFEEIGSVHFARSDVSTRSFDFEIEMKSGQTLIFNSVEKEEYSKLYDYVQNKHLRIRNAKKVESYAEDAFAGSDDEIDPYKATVKAEGRERNHQGDSESDSEDDDYDLDEDLKNRKKQRESSEGSGSEPDEEYDSDANSSDENDSGSGEEDDEEEKPKKKKKEKKERTKKDKEGGGGGKRKSKKAKDPNAPKRASTAYMLWFNENRSSIKKDGDAVADTAKRAGEMWKKMSDDDKKPYEAKAKTDKERYEREMKAYKESGGAEEFKKQSSSQEVKKKKEPKKSVGPSPSKAKSKEFVSDSSESNNSDDDKPLRPKEKAKKASSESSSEASGSGSDSD